MTNQAAQTMPELPEPFDTMVWGEFSQHQTPVYSAGQVHQYARDYAALSQTAGVVLARGWFHALPEEDDYEFHDDASGAGKGCAGCIRAMIVPESAAVANPPQPSASVVERARELLAEEFDGIGMHGVANDVRQNKLAVIDKAIIRAIESALTQQRGEPNGKLVGWWNGIMPDVTERSPYGPSVRWGADAENSGHDIPLYDGYNPIHYTTPQPGAEALRELVQRWRDDSAREYEHHRRQTGYVVDFSHQARSDTLDTCADELDALINAEQKGALHE